jgi:DNA polymerase-1
LDADIIAYKAAILNERNAGTSDDLDMLVRGIVREWCRVSECKSFIVCLSTRCFRYAVASDYKGNRSTKEKPVDLDLAYRILGNFETLKHDGLEADDVLGVYTTRFPEKYTIVSTDKDLLQIPGRHCNPDKQTVEDITPEGGFSRFLWQWLVGDSTDNFGGCPKVGPVKASKFLTQWIDEIPDYVRVEEYPEYLVGRVLREFQSRGTTFAYAVQQARLAKILTTADVTPDFKPVLWSPPDAALMAVYPDWVNPQVP